MYLQAFQIGYLRCYV